MMKLRLGFPESKDIEQNGGVLQEVDLELSKRKYIIPF